ILQAKQRPYLLMPLFRSIGPMAYKFSATTRFLLRLAALLALMVVVAGAWWTLPAQPRAILPVTRGPCLQIRISANEQTLIAIHDYSLAVWDLPRGQELGAIPFPGLNAWQEEILLAPDGLKLALCNRAGVADRVRLWLPATQVAPTRLADT